MKQFLQRAVHLVGLVIVVFVAMTLLQGSEPAVALEEGTCCNLGSSCPEGEGCCPHENLNLNQCSINEEDYCVGLTECPPPGG